MAVLVPRWRGCASRTFKRSVTSVDDSRLANRSRLYGATTNHQRTKPNLHIAGVLLFGEPSVGDLSISRSMSATFAPSSRLYPFRRFRSGGPEMRLKLKSEIRKRISRIEVSFGLDGFEAVADVKFINGVQPGAGNLRRGANAPLAHRGQPLTALFPPRPGPAWASDAYMLRLQAAYAEILASVSEVRHDQLHEDNPEYDF